MATAASPDIQTFRLDTLNLIQCGKLKEAKRAIDSFQGRTHVELRILEHLRGVVAEFSGDLEQAYHTYLLAIEKHGENIKLIADLAGVCYQLDLMAKWRFYHQRVLHHLDEFDAQLSVESKVVCRLGAGKNMEEDGDLIGALDLYEQAFNLSRSVEDFDARQFLYLRVLPQVVRLRSQFAEADKLGLYYTELISLQRAEYPKYLDVEIQHSLMLAEINLIGPHHAWARVKLVLEDTSLMESDRRLVYFDFLEEMLIRGLPLTEDMFAFSELQKSGDSFEQEIALLAFDPQRRRDLGELSDLAAVLSWSCYLRIMILYFSSTEDERLAQELRNKINLILSSLGAQSKAFWLNRMRPYMASDDLTLNFSREKRTIAFQNKELDLSRKKGMLLLLDAMTENNEHSVDEVIQLLWQDSYSPENYHRLRMTVHRLNQLLYDLTAIPKVLEVSADKVSVKPTVCLESISV
ncbi:MAG: hypothetical protein H6624_04285 [Bdellovibrionaceae bacterium]|nr:hypothetical protein [Bdellovibrionales bacterium]MCB9083534.1 hypothetical protein [Pseudobdellovibrionaceae bacterium]